MKKISVLTVLLLSVVGLSHAAYHHPNNDNPVRDKEAEVELVSNLEYIEEHDSENIDLGFDVYQYLPIDFNPYEGMIYPLEDIDYIEEWDSM